MKWKDNYSTEIARLQVKIADVSGEIERLSPQRNPGTTDNSNELENSLCVVETEHIGRICTVVNEAIETYKNARSAAV